METEWLFLAVGIWVWSVALFMTIAMGHIMIASRGMTGNNNILRKEQNGDSKYGPTKGLKVAARVLYMVFLRHPHIEYYDPDLTPYKQSSLT